MKLFGIEERIGNTPHIRLSKLFESNDVWLKDERMNPTGSIKDRAAMAMISDAEQQGLIKYGSTIVEPTSGNTGIGLAMIAALKGYKLILTMPESMSVERRKLLEAYGATIVLTPASLGMDGAISNASEIIEHTPGAWMPMQFSNKSNPQIHYRTTAEEIIQDFPNGVSALVAGVGTAGHISGVGKRLKEIFPSVKVYAVEPSASPVLSGGYKGPHKIQGIGAGFVPDNLDRTVVDEIIKIENDEAFEAVRRLAKREGILAGISTGANIAAVSKLVEQGKANGTVLTFAYDTGDRYLSVSDLWNS
ncbi:cysteine synthase A [Tenuifilum thalassicum]|uniref:Cysteine synthase n=1 Tax=Tenuifilum thalassicum TaxID=2590900 RepID=A0A7D4AW62_9BACT|nr:cysteine synthase A [Tenuifilum thalassicum]QKG79134.1 cysteine synthase A [Tenuifilum thalassicum]